jgi:hypothetical protein
MILDVYPGSGYFFPLIPETGAKKHRNRIRNTGIKEVATKLEL